MRIDGQHRNYLFDVLPGLTLFGLGMATLVTPLVTTVMGSAPPDDVGIASGVNNAVSRSAALLAVAVLPPLAGLTGERYRNPLEMTHSYRIAAAICVGILVIGAIVVTLTVPNNRSVSEGPPMTRETEQPILSQIHALVAEEHHLRSTHTGIGLKQAERQRLETIERQLDECWDLLRHRRADEEYTPEA